MKKNWLIVVIILSLNFILVLEFFFQKSITAKTAPEDTTNIEKRLEEMERNAKELNQRHNILLKASEERNEQLQTLLQWLGIGFIVLTVLFGGMAAVAGWRQSQQQGNLIGAHVRSTEYVSDVLSVVHNILYGRLLRVQEEQKDISLLKTQVEDLTKVVASVKAGIKLQRQRIESTAEKLAKTPRHDFKKHNNIQALNAFAKDFDDFRLQHPEENEFDGQCQYIRGIDAVFNDKFNDIHKYLNQVIILESPKAESDFASRKRLANAYYYLGLNHSNLGELDDAVRFLEKAQILDPEGTDLLTRLVMAEVYVMFGKYKKAEESLQEVDNGFNVLMQKQDGRLWNHQLRMQSRAYLIRINKNLMEKKDEWKDKVKEYAEKAYEIDPDYYYAPFTYAQISQKFGIDKEKKNAKSLFSEAYSKIQKSGHLHFVKETRIRILLFMVAAICAKHGSIRDDREVNKYLDEAKLLRGELPKIDNRICTVFSPLNKQNVNSETIGLHIEEIRKGTILLL